MVNITNTKKCYNSLSICYTNRLHNKIGRITLTASSDVRKCCRYEIFIPLNYNNGSLVEEKKIFDTVEELMKKFGVLTTYPVSLRASGLWKEGDKVYDGPMMVYRLDLGEDDKTLNFFVKYKEKLKKEYRQIELYITRQWIEII